MHKTTLCKTTLVFVLLLADAFHRSQCSLVSNASDGGTRHLALVYFDILVLNDVSVLHKPYSERRALLESLVHVVPGYSMIAKRKRISCLDGADATAEHLSAALARAIADHQEGLVLKAEESRYGDWKLPWVKVRKLAGSKTMTYGCAAKERLHSWAR